MMVRQTNRGPVFAPVIRTEYGTPQSDGHGRSPIGRLYLQKRILGGALDLMPALAPILCEKDLTLGPYSYAMQPIPECKSEKL